MNAPKHNPETLKTRCHAPYSGRKEIALIQSETGNFYQGVRIENSSFPASLDACQIAVCRLLAENETPKTVWANYKPQPFFQAYFKAIDLEMREDFPKEWALKPKHWDGGIEALEQQVIQSAVIEESNFPVSAILIKQDQAVAWAPNVEFKDWTQGVCAERLLLASLLADGLEFCDEHQIRIFTPKGDLCSPCGICRQVIHEHAPQMRMIMRHPDTTFSSMRIRELLPFAFQNSLL